MKVVLASMLLLAMASLNSCQTGGLGVVQGNEGGSQPISEQEAFDMQKAVNRCQRSGGTRVVKIRGQLRCY